MGESVKVAALFAGIAGIERGLGDGFETVMFCENDPSAQAVLTRRYPGVPIEPDVASLRSLPARTEVLTAGFPCTDLSQAGRTAGIFGKQSGLVAHVFRLLDRGPQPTWLVIENVRNMLMLGRGHAMEYVVAALEERNMAWAYRVVDSRAFGLPQRRQRVILVASKYEDPGPVLFSDDHGEPSPVRYRRDAFGFYWTEGLKGIGWAQDAVPTLKGGSTIGIPSPPAVWLPDRAEGKRFITPAISDAERLQGFPRGWTQVLQDGRPMKLGRRWKLVGNAVSVPVARWLGQRLLKPGHWDPDSSGSLEANGRWPTAAYGAPGTPRLRIDVSLWPRMQRYHHLADLLNLQEPSVLSTRATAGFLSRLNRSYLRVPEEFRLDLKTHIEARSVPD